MKEGDFDFEEARREIARGADLIGAARDRGGATGGQHRGDQGGLRGHPCGGAEPRERNQAGGNPQGLDGLLNTHGRAEPIRERLRIVPRRVQ